MQYFGFYGFNKTKPKYTLGYKYYRLKIIDLRDKRLIRILSIRTLSLSDISPPKLGLNLFNIT